jgi:hypothetical protein
MTTFISLIHYTLELKPVAMRQAIITINRSEGPLPPVDGLFELDPKQFKAVPGSAFAYWATPCALECFRMFKSLAATGLQALSTNQLSDDSRYARLWWEVPQRELHHWANWAKGRAYSPYYYDIQTLVRWNPSRGTYTGFLGTKDRPLEKPASSDWFFRPGLTWPRRTNRLSVSILPRGCIFGNKGPTIFADGDGQEWLLAILAAVNSQAFQYLLSLQVARVELAQSFEVGLLQRTPMPAMDESVKRVLSGFARRAWSLKRSLDTTNETSHAFVLPPGLNEKVTGLDRVAFEKELEWIQKQIDGVAFALYGISSGDRSAIEARTRGTSSDTLEEEGVDDDDNAIEGEALVTAGADALNSWLVGVVFGRFDLRLASGERLLPPEPEPFDSLPPRSPGMWPEGEETGRHPDILVDDEDHIDDLGALMRVAAERARSDAGESPRVWLAKEFFSLHIKMYSKSRRKAPIYWQLATPSASYSVWLYIHAFTKDTLFRVQHDYAAPKLAHEERRLESLKSDLGGAGTTAQRKELAAQEVFVEELRTFLEEMKRVAPLWNPNLDDGVIINFAPLWRLVPQHKAWQTELKATWDALCERKYDWTHLAMYLWPERVVPKCAGDRSLAIAHGLEFAFWEEDATGVWKERETLIWPIEDLVAKRSSAAVKAALKSLLEAPEPSGSTKRR